MVDRIAIRKDFDAPPLGLKPGDALKNFPYPVKAGQAPEPTPDDGRAPANWRATLYAAAVLLAAWDKGGSVTFRLLSVNPELDGRDRLDEEDIRPFFA